MEEAEDVDVNAGIHGNWTMENSKSMLHQWMQTSKIKSDYKYSTVGPDHNRSFVAEMGFYVNKLGMFFVIIQITFSRFKIFKPWLAKRERILSFSAFFQNKLCL